MQRLRSCIILKERTTNQIRQSLFGESPSMSVIPNESGETKKIERAQLDKL